MKDKYFLRFSKVLTRNPYTRKCQFTSHKYGIYMCMYLQSQIHKTDNDIKDYNNAINCIKTYKHTPEFTYASKEELENWKYFCNNNSLPLFIGLSINFNQHNCSRNYMPWVADRQYTDDEIYNKFNLTQEEIELIENTIKKFELHTDWFKRFWEGKNYKKICNE